MNKLLLRELQSYIYLWSTQSISRLGSSMTSYALILWVYRQQGTAMSIALLTLCMYLPSVLLSFIAGSIADRWDKKRLMLLSDVAGAVGTLAMLVLYWTSALQIWMVYMINILLSIVDAFQSPASQAAVSYIVPKKHYTRISGMQSFSGSMIMLLTPAAAAAMMSLGSLTTVFIVDILSFGIAFLTLLLAVKIPKPDTAYVRHRLHWWQDCLEGLRFLKRHRALLTLILLFAGINLLAYLSDFSLRPALILGKTGGNEWSHGIVSSTVGIAMMVGGLIVTFIKPAFNKIRVIFVATLLSFLFANVLYAVGDSVWIWVVASIAGYLPVPFISANMEAITRSHVPLEMQGRVFAARNSLQFFTIPIGIFCGGYLADHIFEPMMHGTSALSQKLAIFVGTGDGAGIALIYFICGLLGCLLGVVGLRIRSLYTLNQST